MSCQKEFDEDIYRQSRFSANTNTYFIGGENAFLNALHDWFENKDEDQILLKSISKISDLSINEILNQQFSWNQKNQISYSPTIIIGKYVFPKDYNRNELIYFINDLLDDDNLSFFIPKTQYSFSNLLF